MFEKPMMQIKFDFFREHDLDFHTLFVNVKYADQQFGTQYAISDSALHHARSIDAPIDFAFNLMKDQLKKCIREHLVEANKTRERMKEEELYTPIGEANEAK